MAVLASVHPRSVYDEIARNYMFSVDPWTTAEDSGFIDSAEYRTVNLNDAAKKKYTAASVVDAFSYGNWTRFCNHHCNTKNAAPRCVHVDDADPRRPLLVLFAIKDILPGREITIAYHDKAGDADPANCDPVALREYQREANKRRKAAPGSQKCHCGGALCWRVLFHNEEVNEESDEEREGGEENDIIPGKVEAQLAAVGASTEMRGAL